MTSHFELGDQKRIWALTLLEIADVFDLLQQLQVVIFRGQMHRTLRENEINKLIEEEGWPSSHQVVLNSLQREKSVSGVLLAILHDVPS